MEVEIIIKLKKIYAAMPLKHPLCFQVKPSVLMKEKDAFKIAVELLIFIMTIMRSDTLWLELVSNTALLLKEGL